MADVSRNGELRRPRQAPRGDRAHQGPPGAGAAALFLGGGLGEEEEEERSLIKDLKRYDQLCSSPAAPRHPPSPLPLTPPSPLPPSRHHDEARARRQPHGPPLLPPPSSHLRAPPHRHLPPCVTFSFGLVRGEWSPQPCVTFKRSIFNSNKQYIYIYICC
jgi:hypothetical protein